MAKWIIHDKWAENLGISLGISKYVNKLVDFPEELPEFIEYAKERAEMIVGPEKEIIVEALASLAASHDSARRKSKKELGAFQLSFLREKGDSFVKAYYLHHILDYISECTYIQRKMPINIRENIAMGIMEKLMSSSYELHEVKQFVLQNL